MLNDVFLALCSEITYSGLRGQYRMPEIEMKLIMCKANALCTFQSLVSFGSKQSSP